MKIDESQYSNHANECSKKASYEMFKWTGIAGVISSATLYGANKYGESQTKGVGATIGVGAFKGEKALEHCAFGDLKKNVDLHNQGVDLEQLAVKVNRD